MTKEELVDKIRDIMLKYDETPNSTQYETNEENLWEISYKITELFEEEE